MYPETQPGFHKEPDPTQAERKQISRFSTACEKFENAYDKADQQGATDMNEWVRWNGRALLGDLGDHPMRDKLALAASTGVPSDVFGVIREILGDLPSEREEH